MTQTSMALERLPRMDKPLCFGDPKEWDPEDVICSGGLDPIFVHPTNGSKVRDPCPLFEICGARAQAAKLEPEQTRLLDPRSLLGHRPPPSNVGAFGRAFSSAYTSTTPASPPRPVLTPASPLATVPRPQAMAPYVPPTHTPPGGPQPHFLRVPEPRGAGPLWNFIVRLAVRATGIAIGNAISYAFDTNPLRPPDK